MFDRNENKTVRYMPVFSAEKRSFQKKKKKKLLEDTNSIKFLKFFLKSRHYKSTSKLQRVDVAGNSHEKGIIKIDFEDEQEN